MDAFGGFQRFCSFIAFLIFLIGTATGARAQIGQFSGPAGPSFQGVSAPPRGRLGAVNLRQQKEQAEHALILGQWLIFPSAFLGGLYDSNPRQVSTGAESVGGLRLVMNGLAERNSGISKTDIYGMADGRLYTNGSSTASEIATAQLGGTETYSLRPDWTLSGQGDYTRRRNLFDTFGINRNVTTLNTTGVGLEPTTSPLTYNQLTGTGTVERRFGNAFVDLGGSAVAQLYDNTTATGALNNTVYTGTVGGGSWVTPDIYGFVAGSGDSRNFDRSFLSSNGYRVIAGVGTGRIGLMQGEVYAGYQAEDFRSSSIGTRGGVTFGGQLDYSPLPELDFKLGADRAIGVAQITSTIGNSTTVTDVLGTASYALAPEWTASGHAGYIHTNFNGISRADNSWTVGPTLTYSVWRSFGVTLDYQHIETVSNVALLSFSRDVVSIGISYKY